MAWNTGNFKVEFIQVLGLRGLSQEAVLNQVPLQVGDWFDEPRSEELLKKLYATQWFKEVKLTRRGAHLEIHVVEQPVISQVIFQGKHGLPQDKLDKMLQEIGLVGGEFFNPSALEMLKKLLLQMYLEVGKYTSKVETLVISEAENIVKVQIKVKPGQTLQFASIKLFGVNAFSEARVLAEMPVTIGANRFWGFIEGKAYHCTRTTREKALAALRQFYKNQGYYDIQANSKQLSVTGNRCEAEWVIELKEGPRYKIGKYRILGESYGLTEEKLQSLVQFKSGDTYSERDRLNAKHAIQEYFGEAGYLFAKVNIQPYVNREKSLIDLAIQIERGEKTYVRRIDFLGSRLIRESILRRLILQEEASLASGKAREDSEQGLQQSGWLEQVNIEAVPVPNAKDQVDLAVSIQEAPPRFSLNPIGLDFGDGGSVWHTDFNCENLFGTGSNYLFKVIKDRAQMTGEFAYKSSFRDIGSLRNVRWGLQANLSNHNLKWKFKTFENIFHQSPYVRAMKEHGESIKRVFTSKEKSEDTSSAQSQNSNTHENSEKDSDQEIQPNKIKIPEIDSDIWGVGVDLDFPADKKGGWHVKGEFQSRRFLPESFEMQGIDQEEKPKVKTGVADKKRKKKHTQLMRDFLNEKGDQIDQWIVTLSRYSRQLEGSRIYFPTGGYEWNMRCKLAFSGVSHSNETAGFTKRLNIFSDEKKPLHYYKLNFSGSRFIDLFPKTRLYDHVIGFRWDLGIGQQFSGGALPFFDTYYSGRFNGYTTNSLGPRDESFGYAMVGGSLLAKAQAMYFWPKPLQGDLLDIVGVSCPYRTNVFCQIGNVYELNSLSSLLKNPPINFPLALSVGVAVEVILKLPVVGIMPGYMSLSWPILEGGHVHHKEKHAQYFNMGFNFLMS